MAKTWGAKEHLKGGVFKRREPDKYVGLSGEKVGGGRKTGAQCGGWS